MRPRLAVLLLGVAGILLNAGALPAEAQPRRSLQGSPAAAKPAPGDRLMVIQSLRFADATRVAERVRRELRKDRKAPSVEPITAVEVDQRTNQLLIQGRTDRVNAVQMLISRLDAEEGRRAKRRR